VASHPKGWVDSEFLVKWINCVSLLENAAPGKILYRTNEEPIFLKCLKILPNL